MVSGCVLPVMPGGLKVHQHRELPENAVILSCVFRQDGWGWFVCLQIAVPTPEKRAVVTVIGVDLGLTVFAYCSDNVEIPNPRIARRSREGTAPTATRRYPAASEAVTAAIKCVRKWPNCTVKSPNTPIAGS